MIVLDPDVTTSIVIFTWILDAHERSHASGEPLLTDAGVCLIRQELLSAHLQEKVDVVALPVPLLPFWDIERRQLWLGNSMIKRFPHPISNQITVLAAFRAIGWASRRIVDPLPSQPSDLPSHARIRLRETVRNLNRGMPNGTIHFRLDRICNEVTWDFASEISREDPSLGSQAQSC